MADADGSGDRWTGRRRLRTVVALAAAGVLAALARLCFYQVDTGEYALVTEFGKPVQVVTTPGLGFKLSVPERAHLRQPSVRLSPLRRPSS